jgi:MFS family permease
VSNILRDPRPGDAPDHARHVHAVSTNIPARLDRLPWCRFHVLLVAALGITWILDGLEVTIVGSIGPMLQDPHTLALTTEQIGGAASVYVIGAVFGALLFGWLTDRFGRKSIFSVTLGIYILGVMLSAFSWNARFFMLSRFITGVGIGGEYSAINSAIDELVPARLRGRIDLIVNGSFWVGAGAGAGASLFLLSGHAVNVNLGWRLGFGVGGVLGLVILLMRRWVPESPRWLVTHGKHSESDEVITDIERRVVECTGAPLETVHESLLVYPRRVFGYDIVLRAMFGQYRMRALLVLVLMVAQACLYNAVFFTYGMVLTKYEHVSAARVGMFILPIATSNFLGPVVLGTLFDTVGRRRMIFSTYAISGLLMLIVAYLFANQQLTAVTQTIGWAAIFFFASAAASAAYLTASEVFPLETRATAIALFYAFGMVFAAGTPLIFGWLIGTGGPVPVAIGYGAAAVLMLIAGFTALKLGVDAEGRSLESIAPPVSASF